MVGFFHRDKQVLSIEVDEGRLRQLIQVFEDFLATMTAGMTPEQAAAEWSLSYILRFDEKGYRVFSRAEVLELFEHANVVERLIIALDSRKSVETGRNLGTWVELKLDAVAQNNCWLNVTADTKGNMDAAYQALDDALASAKTRFGMLRSAPARFGIQLFWVVLVFVLSVWGGSLIATHLAIENAFPIAFLFVFLLFSNAWTFLQPWVLRNIDSLFPNIYFKRDGHQRWIWLWQGLVVAAIFAVLTAVVIFLLHYLAGALAPLVKKPT